MLHVQFRDLHAQSFHFVLRYTHVWYDYYRFSNHDTNSCPYHIIDVGGANLEKIMNASIEKMIETTKENMLQYFSQLRKDVNIHEHNFSLGSHIPEVSLDDNFEYSISPMIKAVFSNSVLSSV